MRVVGLFSRDRTVLAHIADLWLGTASNGTGAGSPVAGRFLVRLSANRPETAA
jgi:hypothetical protein